MTLIHLGKVILIFVTAKIAVSNDLLLHNILIITMDGTHFWFLHTFSYSVSETCAKDDRHVIDAPQYNSNKAWNSTLLCSTILPGIEPGNATMVDKHLLKWLAIEGQWKNFENILKFLLFKKY